MSNSLNRNARLKNKFDGTNVDRASLPEFSRNRFNRPRLLLTALCENRKTSCETANRAKLPTYPK